MPLILSEILAVSDQQLATDTLTLRYTPTPQTSSRFVKYRFQLTEVHPPVNLPSSVHQPFATTTLNPESGILSTLPTGTSESKLVSEKWASDTEWKITWHSLVPGRLYDITVWTVSVYDVLSQPLHRQDRLCNLTYYLFINQN